LSHEHYRRFRIVTKAGDWFFLVNFPRTGSTVATHILNSHRDVYCGNEHQTLPLLMTILGSKLFMSPELWFAVRYTKQLNITPRNMRQLPFTGGVTLRSLAKIDCPIRGQECYNGLYAEPYSTGHQSEIHQP
jgi:hypothetical protein